MRGKHRGSSVRPTVVLEGAEPRASAPPRWDGKRCGLLGRRGGGLKKELAPEFKRAEAEGKDLGEAGKAYKAGDEALKKGLQEEAVEHFTRAKEIWPADAK